MLDAIAKYLDGRVEITGDGSGAHVVLWPNKRLSEDAVVALAASRSVGISGISRYFLTKPTRCGLMLGYCRMNEEGIREGVRRLSEIL